MTTSKLTTLAFLTTALSILPAAEAAGESLAPLPRSSYGVRAACSEPPPGGAGCLALQLVPQTAQARARSHPLGFTRSGPVPALSPAAGDYGLRPQDIHSAYALPTASGSPQTIALVDAFNDPTAESDLKAYDEEFALPQCTAANGCLTVVNQRSETANPPFPASVEALEEARHTPALEKEAAEASGWGLEISLDLQAAHATCQSCKILLVEANSPAFSDLTASEAVAEARGANEISNSFGAPEHGVSAAAESASAFNHPGTVITAAAGDNGYLGWDAQSSSQRGYAEFPAASPHVVAVGGTRLSLGAGSSWSAETVWNGNGAGGGGCSVVFSAQPWQQSSPGWPAIGCAAKRAVADVAADADPYSGIAVHDTSPECETTSEVGKVVHVDHWCTIGGTSLASPLVAAVFALAGGAGGEPYPARTLYVNSAAAPASLHDVSAGSNGECATPFQEPSLLSSCSSVEESQSCAARAICLAGSGYDGPSGLGTPDGIAAFQPRGAPEPVRAGEKQAGGEIAGSVGPIQLPRGPSLGTSVPPAPVPAGPPRISSVGLTLHAIIALNRRRPRIAQVGYSFTINASARVRVVLARRHTVNRRGRWVPAARASTITATGGRDTTRLSGHGVLVPGRYRLTLTPLGGVSGSALFQIG